MGMVAKVFRPSKRCCRTCRFRGKYLYWESETCSLFPVRLLNGEMRHEWSFAFDAWVGGCGKGIMWEPAPLLERLRRRFSD